MTTGFKIIIGFALVVIAGIFLFLRVAVLQSRVTRLEEIQTVVAKNDILPTASPSATPTVVLKKTIVPVVSAKTAPKK